jgi:hypothetical protein
LNFFHHNNCSLNRLTAQGVDDAATEASARSIAVFFIFVRDRRVVLRRQIGRTTTRNPRRIGAAT